MSMLDTVKKQLGKVDPRIVTAVSKGVESLPFLETVEKYAKRVPMIKEMIDKEYDGMMADMETSLKPYRKDFKSYAKIPKKSVPRETILKDMEALYAKEESRWKDGFVSGAVYHGDEEHIEFLNKVYAINSQSNPLHSDLWPSASKFESEIVSMTADMLGAELAGEGKEGHICGAVSSGGTDSILLAMKAYRDHAREVRGIKKPEMIMPVTAHAAFDKACKYFNIKRIRVPITKDCRANVAAVKKAITRNTIVIIGSAPSFPHGAVDPIKEMSELARSRGIGFHTDACLGGFILPWAKKLGYHVPPFDFRLPGVTSISADTHKFGYAAKGTSVILYRGEELRHYQYYTIADWPGGIYFSPTFSGSRPGALSAACWAAMVSIGEEGYLAGAKQIMETATKIKAGIESIPELEIMGEPLYVIAFASKKLNIYSVMDYMTKKHWNLNGLHKPSCVHLCVTLRHTQPGVAERFINDLKAAVTEAKKRSKIEGGMAPVYGMAATIPAKGLVGDMLKRYMDLLYKV